jgi:5-methylcytosine-specific restriction endonuclease McrA
VIVSGFVRPESADGVFLLLTDTPAFRDLPDRDEMVNELVERIEHIEPQVVAENIAQDNAIHLKQALENRGAKAKITDTVRVRPPGAGRREAIPAAVRREVWRRDGGMCVDCGSRERLEYDHIIAVANGGSYTVRNIELRCETCNRKKGAKI